MFHNRRRFCLQALGLAGLLRPGWSRAAKAADLDRAIAEALKIWGVPGAAVAVVRKDHVEYLAGHGVRRIGEKAPVTPDTLFPMGSCTKGFTTAALAMLVDAG